MSARIPLAAAIVITICGVGSIALAALGAHGFLVPYLWPANAVVWCWLWYGMTRVNRRLREHLDAARRVRVGGTS